VVAAAAVAVAVAACRYRALRNIFGLIPGFTITLIPQRPHRYRCGKGNKRRQKNCLVPTRVTDPHIDAGPDTDPGPAVFFSY
jgi:hypothetical protein